MLQNGELDCTPRWPQVASLTRSLNQPVQSVHLPDVVELCLLLCNSLLFSVRVWWTWCTSSASPTPWWRSTRCPGSKKSASTKVTRPTHSLRNTPQTVVLSESGCVFAQQLGYGLVITWSYLIQIWIRNTLLPGCKHVYFSCKVDRGDWLAFRDSPLAAAAWTAGFNTSALASCLSPGCCRLELKLKKKVERKGDTLMSPSPAHFTGTDTSKHGVTREIRAATKK